MLGEEGAEGIRVAFAAFAEHPADSLVHQVMRMPERGGALAEGRGEPAAPDEGERGDDSDTVFPERVGIAKW